jgi:hypothetical protein
MIKSRAVFAVSAVFLSAALAATLFINHKPNVKPSQVLTWNCESAEYKPKTIMIYCGDGGAYIDKITWKSWSQAGAIGMGEYYRNLCEPDCSDGKIVHAPVNVRLSNLTPRKGKFYLRTLDMSPVSGKDFPWGESGIFNWDVMEFAEQMNWD